MKWRTRFFNAFLVVTTVNAIGLLILPKIARTEPLQTQTEFGTYVAALPIELRQVQRSVTEKRWHDYIVALLAQPETSVPVENTQEFGTYVAALPIEAVAAPPSETDQQLQQLLVAFLAAPGTTTVATPDFGNDTVALPIALDREQPVTDFPEAEVALLSLPAASDVIENTNTSPQNVPPEAIEQTTNLPSQSVPQSEAEQKYANYLVALREQNQSPNSENTDSQTTSTPSSNDLKFLSPRSNQVLDVPATTVTVQSPANIPVELSVNGELVDTSLIGGTETNNTANFVTQTWYGVPLHQGENTLT
ncbi:TonB-dependent receptor, partial [Chroococcidiopsidales cyanobacterium LEGE 13417]|nr:TonB-dependent receptor [Chroococcidiopsidales cyanobacterium LEGE 13417]